MRKANPRIGYRDIAKVLNRSKIGIFKELERCPKNQYTAEAAQKKVEETWNFSVQKRKPRDSGGNKLYNGQRIDNLEMQMEIVLDLLKALRKS